MSVVDISLKEHRSKLSIYLSTLPLMTSTVLLTDQVRYLDEHLNPKREREKKEDEAQRRLRDHN